jgi:hypothetical protein
MTILSWFKRWRREDLSEVFVVCHKNVPVVACLDRAAVLAETRERSKADTRVHCVPVVRSERS